MSRFAGVILLALLAISCGDDEEKTSVIIGQPTITGITPAQVSLGEQVSGRITGTNLSGVVSVTFGDGIQVSRVQSVNANEIEVEFSVNRNAAAGARTITVVAASGTANASGLLTVRNNTVPVVDFAISGGTKSKNQIIAFSATATDDKQVASYRWDFGDGTSDRGKETTHAYSAAGNYTVTLTVVDNQGGRATKSKGVKVENNFAPVASFTAPSEAEAGTKVSFDASKSSDQDGKIVKYSWDFGDGTKGDGKTVTHTYDNDKTYSVILTVTDNDNAKGVNGREVKVKPGSGGGGGGGNDGTCTLNDFRTNRANVVSVSGNVMTLNRAFRKCRGCAEFRRRGSGIREFVGNVDRFDGFRYTMDWGGLPASTRPRPGETIYLVWKPSSDCR